MSRNPIVKITAFKEALKKKYEETSKKKRKKNPLQEEALKKQKSVTSGQQKTIVEQNSGDENQNCGINVKITTSKQSNSHSEKEIFDDEESYQVTQQKETQNHTVRKVGGVLLIFLEFNSKGCHFLRNKGSVKRTQANQ